MHFVAAIRDTELYIQYMVAQRLTIPTTLRLCATFNDLSTEVCLSSDIIKSIITSCTTATGVAAVVDAHGSKDFNDTEDNSDLDTIGKLLQPVIGVSNTGSICSSISTQQDGALVQLKYPESNGYAIVEVNLALCSKVAHLESNEAWKAYEFRCKIVVPSAVDNVYTQATRLIRTAVERMSKRDDGKKSVFRRNQKQDQRDLDDQDDEINGRSNKRRRNRF